MITKITLKNFKRFNDHEFSLRANGLTLLAGGNNSGKSSVLQALALWEYCRGVVESRKGRAALEGQYTGSGIPTNSQNFSPLSVPSFEHLWTNLNPRNGYQARQPNASYTLRIGCEWSETDEGGNVVQRSLEFGLMLSHERLFIKPVESNVTANTRIPRCAYLPPFAGIADREERMSRGTQNRLIGRGLAGAVLRNIVFDLHLQGNDALTQRLNGRRRLTGEERRAFYQSEPWFQLVSVLGDVFKCELRVKPFDDDYSSAVMVSLMRGSWQNGRLRGFPGYKPRDLMVEGSGFLQWLSVYALAVRPDVDVLLLDEPDAHLHPSLQGSLLERLRSLARENNKQVLMATHSTEILKRVEPSDIYSFGTNRRNYLISDSQRVALFEGIGSEYCPKLDQLRRHRRVLFHEGPTDEEFLRIIAARYGRPLPNNLVFWQYGKKHPERKILFDFLATEIPQIKGMSLLDRDSLELGAVDANLVPRGIGNYGELRPRTWRRRQMENYLLLPSVIARISNQPVNVVEDFLQQTWGVPCGNGVDCLASDCSPGLKDARGKETLYEGTPGDTGVPRQSVQQRFGCDWRDIAQSLQPNEIAADLGKIIDEIHQMCNVP